MTAPFRDQDWQQREAILGDPAEAAFEAWIKCGYVRTGLQRPPLAMHKLPTRIRYTPDYLTAHAYYEVQGYGRDQTLKVKLEKWSCLHWWNDLHPVKMFVWDSHFERSCVIDLPDLDEIIQYGGTTLGTFREGKPYFAFAADDVMARANR